MLGDPATSPTPTCLLSLPSFFLPAPTLLLTFSLPFPAMAFPYLHTCGHDHSSVACAEPGSSGWVDSGGSCMGGQAGRQAGATCLLSNICGTGQDYLPAHLYTMPLPTCLLPTTSPSLSSFTISLRWTCSGLSDSLDFETWFLLRHFYSISLRT